MADEENNKTTKGKKRWTLWLSGAIVCIALGIAGWSWISDLLRTKKEYVPIEEFSGAYQAMQPVGQDYDLEKTIRIINSLEVAQGQAQNFDQFLEYMARQDYRGVAPEVLEAKAKMMPVLQEMYLLQKQHEELNMWTSLARQLGNDALVQDEGHRVVFGQGIKGLLEFTKVTNRVFEAYRKHQALSGKIEKELQSIRKDYLAYLEEFTPVYVKYMTEWDKMCMLKDKAYIDLYTNQPAEVVKDCDKILSTYPTNREALLLKSLGLVLEANHSAAGQMFEFSRIADTLSLTQRDLSLAEAQKTLDQYFTLYPDQSAPALVVQGLLLDYQGQHAQAFSHYDQASMEYPRQATQLTDLLNSYRARTYLNNSREGLYLLTLYKSTMEGFGYFSPNLIKAAYYDQMGDYDNCSKEIYNHFFRRSNQSNYDNLLTDMRLCETYMPVSFNRLLPERNYVDITIGKSGKLLGFASDASNIDVEVDNRSDHDLENLRVFLCIHYTDMYSDDYHVIKMPTINRIPLRSKTQIEKQPLEYPDKNFDDIAHVRAIAMTDNSICWIDNVYNSTDNVDYNKAHTLNFEQLAKALDSNALRTRAAYLGAIRKSDDTYRQAILSQTRVFAVETGSLLRKTHRVEIELPRELILITPTFTWGKTLMPTENFLKGSFIHLAFEAEVPEDKAQVMYVTSPYLNYAVVIKNTGGKLKVSDVKNLEKK